MHTHYDMSVREYLWKFNYDVNFCGPTSLSLSNALESLPIRYCKNKLKTYHVSLLLKNLIDNWKVENYFISNPSHEYLLTQSMKELLDDC